MTAPVTAGAVTTGQGGGASPGRQPAPPGGAPAPGQLTAWPPGGGPSAADPAGTGRVLAALAAVRDPELDEPITTLGFVAFAAVSAAGEAVVRLRLPTYFCAPNFAFLMVADAYDAVSALDGVRSAAVELEDHFASGAINHGVAARAGFAASFGGEAVGELHQLRADFLRKAVMAGTDRLCRRLLSGGAELGAMTLGQVPASAELSRLRQRRGELGLPVADESPLVIDPVTGAAVGNDALPLHLRKARTTRMSVEANTGICRGMLRHRYDSPGLGEEDQ
jgi:metal-sulfur cluster biosynthetic enzyme